VGRIHLAQDREEKLAVLNRVMKLPYHKERADRLLAIRKGLCFSGSVSMQFLKSSFTAESFGIQMIPCET
jgi:hypothetical protein